MNETTTAPDRLRTLLLILTLLNTIFAALLSGLRVDANIRADQATRDSQYFGMLAANEVVHFGREGGYEFQLLLDMVNEAQQSQILTLTALELEDAGEAENSALLSSQSQVAQSRYEKGITLSVLYSDPRYAPDEPGGFPDAALYLTDRIKASEELTARQHVADDEYYRWDKKADSYIAVLSILAIAFFLLGLAQSTTRLRLFFGISALVVMLLAAAWTGFILVL